MTMTTSRLDHVAVETSALERDVQAWCECLGYSVIRRGTNILSGDGIALLRGPDGDRLEMLGVGIVEPAHAHLAYRVDDVEGEATRLCAGAFVLEAPAIQMPAVQAVSAVVRSPGGIRLQLIKYERSSPDY